MLIQIINLDRSPDRLAAITADLDHCAVPWRRQPGVEPPADYLSALPIYNRARARKTFGRDLRIGEVGCFQSHLAVIRHLAASGAACGLVLEDDARIDQSSMAVIRALHDVLADAAPDWACVNLVHAQKLRRRPVAAVAGRCLFRAYQFPLLTGALLWRHEPAVAFLNWVEDVGIFAPIDNQLRHWISLGQKGYSFDVPPVVLRRFTTTTGVRADPGAADEAKLHANKFTIHELRQKLPLYLRSGRDHLLRR